MKKYIVEIGFVILVILVSIGGFWKLFIGAEASPNGFHFLHMITSLGWLSLIALQLYYIAINKRSMHRKVGMSIFFMGPLVFASLVLLCIHSAKKGFIAGEEDGLIVLNIATSLEVGLMLLLSILLRKNRKLHGNFLLSSATLFLGIALFFFLLSFVPMFKIEGPETFYRFGTAGATARWTCIILVAILFARNYKHGWPWLLVASFFFLNGYLDTLIVNHYGKQRLTDQVGSFSEPTAFLLSLLMYTGLMYWAWIAGKRKKRAA